MSEANAKEAKGEKNDGQLALLKDPGGDARVEPQARGGGDASGNNQRWTIGEISMVVEALDRGERPDEIAAVLRRSAPAVRSLVARLLDESDEKVLGIACLADTTKATLAEVRRKAKIEKSARVNRKIVGVSAPLAHLQAHVEAVERGQFTSRQLSLFLLAVELAAGNVPASMLDQAPIDTVEREKVIRIAGDIAGVGPTKRWVGVLNKKTETFRTVRAKPGELVDLNADEIVVELPAMMDVAGDCAVRAGDR